MKDNSLIYDNSLISQRDFINTILHPTPKEQLPILEIKEMQYYYNKYQNLSNYGRIIKE